MNLNPTVTVTADIDDTYYKLINTYYIKMNFWLKFSIIFPFCVNFSRCYHR